MGYILLWIENLAVSLLFMTVIFALVARIRRRWLRWVILAPIGIFVLLIYLALTIGAVVFEYEVPGIGWILPSLTLLISYVIGIIGLAVCGSRPARNELSIKAAAVWPPGKLAIALLVAIGLHLMTLWNMDLEAQRQLASLRVEAGVLAASVTPLRVPDGDNAALLYEQAGQALSAALNINYGDNKVTKNPAWNNWVDSMDKPDFDPKDPELAQFLQQQSGTISLVLQAVKKPGCYFEHDYNRPSFAMLLPEIPSIKLLAKLLALHARWKASSNDYKAAMEDINAMFITADNIRGESFLIATLVSAAIDSMATETLQNIIASHRLDAGELDLLKLNAGISYHKSMQRALLYEEALRLSIFSDIGRMGFSQSLNVNGLGSLNGSTWGFKILLLNDEIIVHQWYSNEINALASNPYYEVKDKLRNLIDSVNKQWGVPKSVLMPILLPAIDRYFETITSADANRRIVELALDMCRYRDKHGNYPEKLDELVPDYIAFVPLDPFDGKSMRLKQVDGKLVVYSVGPDEIDDGGMPYNQETRKGDITFELPNKRD